MKFCIDFHGVAWPLWRKLSNGSDVKYIFPRCWEIRSGSVGLSLETDTRWTFSWAVLPPPRDLPQEDTIMRPRCVGRPTYISPPIRAIRQTAQPDVTSRREEPRYGLGTTSCQSPREENTTASWQLITLCLQRPVNLYCSYQYRLTCPIPPSPPQPMMTCHVAFWRRVVLSRSDYYRHDASANDSSLHTWTPCGIASHSFFDSRAQWHSQSFWCWALMSDLPCSPPSAPQEGTHGSSDLALTSGIDQRIPNTAWESEVSGNHVKAFIESVFADKTTSYPGDPEGQEQHQKRPNDYEHVNGGTVLLVEFRTASELGGLGGDARGFDTFLSGRLEDRIIECDDNKKGHDEQSESVDGFDGTRPGSLPCPGLFTYECLVVVRNYTWCDQGLTGHNNGRKDPQVEHRLGQIALCGLSGVQQGLLHYGSVPGMWDVKGSTIKQLPLRDNKAGTLEELHLTIKISSAEYWNATEWQLLYVFQCSIFLARHTNLRPARARITSSNGQAYPTNKPTG